MKKNINERGFHLVVIPLIVIIVGIIGFTGWYVWNSNSKPFKELDNITANNPRATPSPTPTVSVKSTPLATPMVTTNPQQPTPTPSVQPEYTYEQALHIAQGQCAPLVPSSPGSPVYQNCIDATLQEYGY
jgi:hypothetical protein